MALRDNEIHRPGTCEPPFEFAVLLFSRAVSEFLSVLSSSLSVSSPQCDCLVSHFSTGLHSLVSCWQLRVVQTTFHLIRYNPPALASVLRFHTETLVSLVCSSPFVCNSPPRFHAGNYLVVAAVLHLPEISLMSAGSVLHPAAPNPRSRFYDGNWWWCAQGLLLGQAAVIHYCWSVKVFVCLVWCR